MVERQLPKLHTRVRFPSPAPVLFGLSAKPTVVLVTAMKKRKDKIDRLVETLTAKTMAPVSYERKFVAFYDVLGWRQKIAEAGNDPEMILALKAAVTGWSLLSDTGVQNRGFKTCITTFSDNVVISEPVEGPNFHLLLFRLGYMQVLASWSGLLIRGAITIGDIVHDESIVFGPALNRAYELESQQAIYPRIILDPDVGDGFGELPPFMAEEGGLTFIDPFTPVFLVNWRVQQERMGATFAIDEQHAAMMVIKALRDEITKPLGDPQWKKLDWLFRRACAAFKVDERIRKYQRKRLNGSV